MLNLFNEDYYERGIELGISGYSNYRWIPEMTMPMCHQIITQLGIKQSDIILDFGCAKGYLVKSFRLFGYECYGVDISSYAIGNCHDDIRKYLYQINEDSLISNIFNFKFDWIIAKDVLEHIHCNYLEYTLRNLSNSTNNLFSVIPLGDGFQYHIPGCNKDITHKIYESSDWWINMFNKSGFYQTKYIESMKDIRESWKHFEKGVGFFVSN